MDWLLVLASATFIFVVAYLVWNLQSTKRLKESGRGVSGVGGKSDPLSGNTDGIRPAHELQASLDSASSPDKT